MTSEFLTGFDFHANEKLGDAFEIAGMSSKRQLTRSERGWCVLWAMSEKSGYEVLRLGLKQLAMGGTVDYERKCVIGPHAQSVIGL